MHRQDKYQTVPMTGVKGLSDPFAGQQCLFRYPQCPRRGTAQVGIGIIERQTQPGDTNHREFFPSVR